MSYRPSLSFFLPTPRNQLGTHMFGLQKRLKHPILEHPLSRLRPANVTSHARMYCTLSKDRPSPLNARAKEEERLSTRADEANRSGRERAISGISNM